jgi:Uma2 family endonuclease
MTAIPKKFYTPEEYLERELEADYKSEYLNGEIFPMGDFEGDTPEAMAGARSRHNAIRENLSGEAYGLLKKKGGGCRSFSADQRIHIPRTGLYTYPDFLIVCGKPAYLNDTSDTLTNPVLIAEVLSKRTASYDRAEKFAHYRSIPTLREYLILDSRRVGVELWRKNQSGFWTLVAETDQPDQELYLESVGASVPLADLYANVDDLPPVLF